MGVILRRPHAADDLVGIWLNTFDKWGEEQADRYLDDIENTLMLLSDQPLISAERPEFDPPVRIHHHKHHLLIYLLVDGGIEVIRVLHERMNIDNYLAER